MYANGSASSVEAFRLAITRQRDSGFSMIELMVTVTVAAILILAALPTVVNVIANGEVRSAAENLASGVQIARNEAVKRNQNVTLTQTATGWTADTVVNGVPETIQSRDVTQTSGVVTTPATFTLTFDALGRSITGPLTINVSKPTSSACEPAGRVRCLNVEVLAGGQSRLCDPRLSFATDPRGC